MDPEKNETLSPEEQTAEEEALQEAKEDKVRETIVADLGLEDNDDNKELIEKLVGREIGHRTKLSKAVSQKIDWRTKAQGTNSNQPPAKKTSETGPLDAEGIRKETEATVTATFEKRDLDEMDYSDNIKEQIKKVANFQGISVRKAEKDPYIQSLIETETRQASVNEAANNGSGKRKSAVKIDTSKPLDPSEFDLSTPEGRAEWQEAKVAHRQS